MKNILEFVVSVFIYPLLFKSESHILVCDLAEEITHTYTWEGEKPQ